MQPIVPRPAIKGIHHLKLAVSDLAASLRFYQRAFGAERIAAADHRRTADGTLYAHILDVPGLGTFLELRLDPERARRHRLFDPVTLAVEDRSALERWADYLDSQQVGRSPVITAVRGWLMVVEDPDQNRLRLYTLETHGPELKPDEDNPWLQS